MLMLLAKDDSMSVKTNAEQSRVAGRWVLTIMARDRSAITDTNNPAMNRNGDTRASVSSVVDRLDKQIDYTDRGMLSTFFQKSDGGG
jgi:hypothetical protein